MTAPDITRAALVAAVPPSAERKSLLSPADAAREAKMSVSNIRRRCAQDGLGFKIGGRGEWHIRPADLDRWLAGEKIR